MNWQRFDIFNDSPKAVFAQVIWACSQKSLKLSKINLHQLCHPLVGTVRTQAHWPKGQETALLISYLPGVTQNSALGFRQALSFITGLKLDEISVYTGTLTFFPKNLRVEEKKRIESENHNPLIESAQWFSPEDFLSHWNDFPQAYSINRPSLSRPEVATISVESLVSLENINQKCGLGLSTEELKVIQNFFLHPQTKEARRTSHLPPSPTDVEIEIIAQSWSEHCKHKIFRAQIEHLDSSGEKLIINGPFNTFIRECTEKIIREAKIPWARSLFKDNAGVVCFDGETEIALKVETHNTPSVLDPYGGALTGILGVNRDIMGTGIGALPIANMNMLVLGDLELMQEEMPDGIYDPTTVLLGVHKGLVDGGNKSGIPTVNGSMSFYPEFNERPLVYCGTVGIMKKGEHQKQIKSGDFIIMAGGKIGRDGLHGATASSSSMDASTSASIVQIGDPFTQKKLMDFLQACRQENLYRFITDNGAGGLSSSIGEMAEVAGGAWLEIAKAPLKTQGLAPWEIVLSESQERMSLAVAPEKYERMRELADQFEVEISKLGHFNQTGHFSISWKNELIASLPLSFLFDQCPTMNLKSRWYPGALNSLKRNLKSTPMKRTTDDLLTTEFCLQLLAHPNIADKSKLIGQFDQEVQGASLATPYKQAKAGAIMLKAHASEAKGQLFIAHGLSSPLSLSEPKIAAQRSLSEAISNLVIHGVRLGNIALTDNYCMPDPLPSKGNILWEEKCGALVEMNIGMSEAAYAYSAPFISGKDSMKNDFKWQGQRFSIAPTLLSTAIGYVPDEDKSLLTKSIPEGQHLYTLGLRDLSVKGSLIDICGWVNAKDEVIAPDLSANTDLFKLLSKAIQQDLITNAQDISEGGAFVALAEMLMQAQRGVEFKFLTNSSKHDLPTLLFGEASASFVVAVAPQKAQEFHQHFSEHSPLFIGTTTLVPQLLFRWDDQQLQLELGTMLASYRRFL